MTTIKKGGSPLTLVNVFHVEPANQQALVDLLIAATEQTMRHIDGFVSANIHKSLDGKRVVNYAQWRSREDFEAMLNNPEAGPHMKKAAGLVESYDPILCEVVEALS
jgi:quinol monooxygenase YgiN